MAALIESPQFALSIKQPWATLVLLGLKTIEIRRWPTPVRGRIYLHAGKMTDERPECWLRVPEEHFGLTTRRGGLIGTVELVECVTYRSVRDFARHRQLHFNDPTWFLPPRLYGFRFESPKIVPFRAFAGQVRFFTVRPVTRSLARIAQPMPTAPETPDVAPSKVARRKLVQFELDSELSRRLGKRPKN